MRYSEQEKAEFRKVRETLMDARRILKRLSDAETGDGGWAAGVLVDRLDFVSSDVDDVLEDQAVPWRVTSHVVGLPESQDPGGGFGARALQALAMCREARMGADYRNAPLMMHAMARISRAWLQTCGYQRAGALRAILTHGLDEGIGNRTVAEVNACMAQDPEAQAIIREHAIRDGAIIPIRR